MRIMNLLLQTYFDILLAECEIFLNFVIHFLDHERVYWQRITAMEVCCRESIYPTCGVFFHSHTLFHNHALINCSDILLSQVIHALVSKPALLESLCRSSDMKNGGTKVLLDLVSLEARRLLIIDYFR